MLTPFLPLSQRKVKCSCATVFDIKEIPHSIFYSKHQKQNQLQRGAYQCLPLGLAS